MKDMGTTDRAVNTTELDGNRKVRFLPVKEFEKELRSRVEEYFRDNDLTKRDSFRMYIKTGIVLAWLIVSYSLLVFGGLSTLWSYLIIDFFMSCSKCCGL